MFKNNNDKKIFIFFWRIGVLIWFLLGVIVIVIELLFILYMLLWVFLLRVVVVKELFFLLIFVLVVGYVLLDVFFI